MYKIKPSAAKKIAKKLGLNLKVYPLKLWKKSMEVELEHGKRWKITNITNDDLLKTGKITLAHIIEFPDYYIYLFKMERKLEKKWKGKKKPSVTLKKAQKY